MAPGATPSVSIRPASVANAAIRPMVSSNLPRRSILASQWFRRGVLSAHAGFGLVPDGCDTSAAGHIDIPRATNQGGELYGPMATTATRRKEGCLPITAVHDWPAVSRDDQGKLSLRQFEIDEVAGGGGPLIHSSYATWGDTTVSIPGGLLDDNPHCAQSCMFSSAPNCPGWRSLLHSRHR